ncbi:hypothetical protein HanXRQr2_Chr14g0663301 [Helianthus annuus]|uniref:Uncharacterized protein n=1 Tax=Helianthus annuus TaxID=4232 RepID=A0A9K3H898_HELAN|nr:hypothetical protein HanXRQr2_Chr14g0663301 [Helianthus annuus]KAJ0841986.1 hypothetical protein HanPSC8_Chr14g0636571 [Helianthus annuus]
MRRLGRAPIKKEAIVCFKKSIKSQHHHHRLFSPLLFWELKLIIKTSSLSSTKIWQ